MRRTVAHSTFDTTIEVSRAIRAEDGAVYASTTLKLTPKRPIGRKRTVAQPVEITLPYVELKALLDSV